jgi:hypothetical protein
MTVDSDQCSCGHVEGRPTQAYNEEAFRYFLEIERKRSEISSRPFLLLLVDVKNQGGGCVDIPSATAAQLFEQLARCLRDTDFIGWYYEGRVVGAVLTQRPEMAQTDASPRVVQRIRMGLDRELDADVCDRIHVRAYMVPPMPERDVVAREGHN